MSEPPRFRKATPEVHFRAEKLEKTTSEVHFSADKALQVRSHSCVNVLFKAVDHEFTAEVDTGYCFDLCCTFDREHKRCMMTPWGTVPQGYCGISIPYKLSVIKREQDRAKPWMQGYMKRLLHKQGADKA